MICGFPSGPFLYPIIQLYGNENFPCLYPIRFPRATFWLIDSLSACAKALSTVRIISDVIVPVLIFSFSKITEKCRWRERAPHAKADDNALNLAELAMQCMKQTKCCRAAWASLWERTNKPYGFEVIDIRLSGLEGRFETAAHQMEKLARNEPNTLETLFCSKLRYLSDETGHFSGSGPWSDCISACRI